MLRKGKKTAIAPRLNTTVTKTGLVRHISYYLSEHRKESGYTPIALFAFEHILLLTQAFQSLYDNLELRKGFFFWFKGIKNRHCCAAKLHYRGKKL